MRRFFLATFFLALLLLTSACVPSYYQKGILRKKVIDSYNNEEPLTLRNFIICNIIGRQGYIENIKVVETDSDSLLAIFEIALSNNGIKITRIQGENRCNDGLIAARPLRGNDIKTEDAIALLDRNLEGLQMIPIIYIDNHIIFTGSISSAGVTDDSGFLFMPFVTLLIFIFDGDELIYRHMVTHKADALRAPYLDEAHELTSAGTVTQENWDELVRRTMRRYKKRLEK